MALSSISIAVKGIGFGSIAIALSGFAILGTPVVPPATIPVIHYGGTHYSRSASRTVKLDTEKIRHRAEEEIMIAIIVSAVTHKLLE